MQLPAWYTACISQTASPRGPSCRAWGSSSHSALTLKCHRGQAQPSSSQSLRWATTALSVKSLTAVWSTGPHLSPGAVLGLRWDGHCSTALPGIGQSLVWSSCHMHHLTLSLTLTPFTLLRTSSSPEGSFSLIASCFCVWLGMAFPISPWQKEPPLWFPNSFLPFHFKACLEDIPGISFCARWELSSKLTPFPNR